MLVDTHAHLDMEQFDGDRRETISRALEAGVGEILNVGYNGSTLDSTLRLADEYPSVWAALGIHPHNASDWDDALEEKLKQLLLRSKVLAVGEIGLDYYRDLSPRERQREVFRRQIGIALYFGKPIVVHCRDAFEDVIRILREEGASETGGIFHAFSGGGREAEAVLGIGFLIGIGGPLTYRNSKLPEVAARLPSSAFVLETDCPYLPPEPHRGKRNEPALVRIVAGKMAELRGVGIEDIERASETSYRRLLHGEEDYPLSIAYGLKGNVYVNVTSSCTSDCVFCPRLRSDNYLYGYNLNLLTDPTVDEMVAAANTVLADGGKYEEIVFCGYGEPTARIKDLSAAARELRSHRLPMRLNTNGHGNMINRRDIVPELAGLFERISVSLNAPDEATYMNVCRPDAGERAFAAVVDFIERAASSEMECTVSALDYPGIDLEATRKLVESIPGARFRARKYHLASPAMS
jgi:TatD DNase family protein